MSEASLSIEQLEPWNDLIVARRDHETEETESGLIIPETYRDRPLACTVIRTGPSVEKLPDKQRILIDRWAGTDIKLKDGSWLVLLRPPEVVCLINDDL